MDSRPQREREDPNDDGFGWLWKGIAAIGIASAAAVVVGAAISASRDEKEDKKKSSNSMSQNPGPASANSHRNNPYSSIVEEKFSLKITVDATRNRGGGIIQFSSDPALYFYSVDWTNVFQFPQEADKFEMVNALVALEIVRQFHPWKYHEILLQTDNSYAKKHTGFGSLKLHYQLYLQVIDAINTLLFDPVEQNRKICQVFKYECPYMKLADNLSRNNMDAFYKNLEPVTDRYFTQNISTEANVVLSSLKPTIPPEFWK